MSNQTPKTVTFDEPLEKIQNLDEFGDLPVSFPYQEPAVAFNLTGIDDGTSATSNINVETGEYVNLYPSPPSLGTFDLPFTPQNPSQQTFVQRQTPISSQQTTSFGNLIGQNQTPVSPMVNAAPMAFSQTATPSSQIPTPNYNQFFASPAPSTGGITNLTPLTQMSTPNIDEFFATTPSTTTQTLQTPLTVQRTTASFSPVAVSPFVPKTQTPAKSIASSPQISRAPLSQGSRLFSPAKPIEGVPKGVDIASMKPPASKPQTQTISTQPVPSSKPLVQTQTIPFQASPAPSSKPQQQPIFQSPAPLSKPLVQTVSTPVAVSPFVPKTQTPAKSIASSPQILQPPASKPQTQTISTQPVPSSKPLVQTQTIPFQASPAPQSASRMQTVSTQPAPSSKPLIQSPAPLSKPLTQTQPAPSSKPQQQPIFQSPAPLSKPLTQTQPAPLSKSQQQSFAPQTLTTTTSETIPNPFQPAVPIEEAVAEMSQASQIETQTMEEPLIQPIQQQQQQEIEQAPLQEEPMQMVKTQIPQPEQEPQPEFVQPPLIQPEQQLTTLQDASQGLVLGGNYIVSVYDINEFRKYMESIDEPTDYVLAHFQKLYQPRIQKLFETNDYQLILKGQEELLQTLFQQYQCGVSTNPAMCMMEIKPTIVSTLPFTPLQLDNPNVLNSQFSSLLMFNKDENIKLARSIQKWF